MERTLEHFKEDILSACDDIAKYIEGETLESFVKNSQVFDAVMMKLIVIGEASTHFPNEIRERNTDIRWTSVVGLRNFLAHEYFEIDPRKIWTTVTTNVPELREQVAGMRLE